MFLKRFLLLVLFFGAGIFIVYYREKIVRVFGKNSVAEKYLGAGGTYNMWVLIGMIVMLVGLLILLGKLSFMGF